LVYNLNSYHSKVSTVIKFAYNIFRKIFSKKNNISKKVVSKCNFHKGLKTLFENPYEIETVHKSLVSVKQVDGEVVFSNCSPPFQSRGLLTYFHSLPCIKKIVLTSLVACMHACIFDATNGVGKMHGLTELAKRSGLLD
jgi:hypothetical protein